MMFKLVCWLSIFLPSTVSAFPTTIGQIADKETVLRKAHRMRITDLCVSKDGKLMASLCRSGLVKVWDLKAEKLKVALIEDTTYSIYRMALHPNGKWLITSDRSGPIRIWNLNSKKQIQQISDVTKSIRTVRSLEIRPDGKQLLFNDHNVKLNIAPIGKGSPPVQRRKPIATSVSARYSPDGKWIAFRDSYKPLTIVLWDTATEKEVSRVTLKYHGQVHDIIISPDRKSLFVRWNAAVGILGTTEPRISHWDIEKNKLIRNFEMDASAMALSPDGKMLAIANRKEHGYIRLHDAASGKLLRKLFEQTDGSVGDLEFTPDNSKLIAAVWRDIVIWNIGKMPARQNE